MDGGTGTTPLSPPCGDSAASEAPGEDCDDEDAEALQRAARECDAEYAALDREERTLTAALVTLRREEEALRRAAAECEPGSAAPSAPSREAEAVRRLQQALMMDSSGSDSDDDANEAKSDITVDIQCTEDL